MCCAEATRARVWGLDLEGAAVAWRSADMAIVRTAGHTPRVVFVMGDEFVLLLHEIHRQGRGVTLV